MFCGSCGTEVGASRFCPGCGAEQAIKSDSGSQPMVQGAAADPAEALIGRSLDDKYRLDGKLAAGGMGTVYRATRLMIGDEVAVKVLHKQHVNDSKAVERFRREAQAAARLKHPNAVPIYDFGVSADGLVYLVMELVEGESLRATLKQGLVAPAVALEITRQVCSGLDEAHRHKIVHRDIKPENIMVNRDAGGLRVKILDFGIAKLSDVASGDLTQTGSVIGTPHYMSPEQCLGEQLDGRSDIYSVGVVLYEMLAGVVPFNAPMPTAIVIQHVNQAPAPLRSLNSSLSLAAEAVVMHALEKRREARPPTAGALADELAAALGAEPRVPTPTSPVSVAPPTDPALAQTVQMQIGASNGGAAASRTTKKRKAVPGQQASSRAPALKESQTAMLLAVIAGATIVAVVAFGFTFRTLLQRREASQPTASPAAQAAETPAPRPATPRQAVPPPQPQDPALPPEEVAAIQNQVAITLESWRQAWQAGDLDTYMAHYSPAFYSRYKRMGYSQWRSYKDGLFASDPYRSVEFSDLAVVPIGSDAASARFYQTYSAPSYSDFGRKDMTLKLIGGVWRIAGEEFKVIRR